jgi:hypothetical protein
VALDDQEIGARWVLRRFPIAGRDEAIAFLSHLTHPARRLVLLPLGDRSLGVPELVPRAFARADCVHLFH